jgi:Na+-driven multidrug efflux pump
LATVIAQSVALSLSLRHFSREDSFLHFKRGIFRLRRKIVSGILSIGTAPFLLHLCASVVVIFVNKALQLHGGDLYIGAYGVINRVVMLFIMVVSGLNQGMQPIVGYNYGAKQYLRVMKTLFMTIFCATCVTTAGFLIGELFPRQVALLFVGEGDLDSTQLIEAVCEGLRIVVVFFPIVGFQIVTSNFFQYIGKPKRAILLSMTRQMLFLVPLLILLPSHYGTLGVWWSMPIADCAATLLAALLLFQQIRKFKKNPSSEVSI